MPRTRSTRRSAVAFFIAWPFLLIPAAGAVTGNSGGVGHAPGDAEGLKAFQAEHGLRATGSVDPATANALRTASDAELRRVFAGAADLGREQLANARTVIGVGKGAGIPQRGQVIALMAAMQESKFVNYTEPVNGDSLGIFQQRPSAGWGTREQITDVATSAKSFYGVEPSVRNPGLLAVANWQTMPLGDACQAVQRSAHPDRYAQWERFARELLAREGPSAGPIR
ncbi:peptidoglycan-binding domain-containing protein [Streptomyces iconiensis]|uniref:Peptidoglycan-binding domain-containing protein n=1 Tax=Streptomyces iconiensis TaxID=1384038 RepID=A0ABT6ZQW9_9ACTN|nr:peptidoglycan-binding domain-containing protein [Streptomyces iconiensis]MDJ1131452.1 peptidoglycan-binding domain-containing protein [Streptomyces iconiensis]